MTTIEVSNWGEAHQELEVLKQDPNYIDETMVSDGFLVDMITDCVLIVITGK